MRPDRAGRRRKPVEDDYTAVVPDGEHEKIAEHLFAAFDPADLHRSRR